MAYTKTNWVNGVTPVNADNMNKIEDGVANALAKPDAVLSSNELVGVGINGEQVRVQLGEGLTLSGDTSPYTLSASGGTQLYKHVVDTTIGFITIISTINTEIDNSNKLNTVMDNAINAYGVINDISTSKPNKFIGILRYNFNVLMANAVINTSMPPAIIVEIDNVNFTQKNYISVGSNLTYTDTVTAL